MNQLHRKSEEEKVKINVVYKKSLVDENRKNHSKSVTISIKKVEPHLSPAKPTLQLRDRVQSKRSSRVDSSPGAPP